MLTKFRNAGQACISANRIYVHDAIYDEFAAGLVDRVQRRLILGNGRMEGVTCGPLINSAAVKKVRECIYHSRQAIVHDVLGY